MFELLRRLLSRLRFPFREAENLAVFTTVHVLNGKPILRVTHDADDGAWQFLCATTSSEQDARVVALRHVYALDPSVGELADLPLGWAALRESPSAPWQRLPNASDT